MLPVSLHAGRLVLKAVMSVTVAGTAQKRKAV